MVGTEEGKIFVTELLPYWFLWKIKCLVAHYDLETDMNILIHGYDGVRRAAIYIYIKQERDKV
jgi:hypothetical protein